MINRNNWKLTQNYLKYRLEVDQLAPLSLKQDEIIVRYILEWAQETSFLKASKIRPTLPDYLANERTGSANGKVAKDYLKRLLTNSQRFFRWLAENEKGYELMDGNWIKKLKMPRMVEEPREKKVVTLEEVHTMAGLPTKTIQEKRIQAMTCFLFLSGIRIGAFVSMPLLVVDIEKRMVLQHPNLGVQTKNSKHATTFLLDIPELLEVVTRWDQYVRSRLPDRGYWFAPLHPRTGDIDETNIEGNQNRTHLARHDLRIWCEENNIQYRNPHAFRHGHIHYGLKHAKNMEDYKAISLNVMHANMGITDQIYSKLNPDEIKNKIDQLGKSAQDLGLDDLEKLRKIQEILGL